MRKYVDYSSRKKTHLVSLSGFNFTLLTLFTSQLFTYFISFWGFTLYNHRDGKKRKMTGKISRTNVHSYPCIGIGFFNWKYDLTV